MQINAISNQNFCGSEIHKSNRENGADNKPVTISKAEYNTLRQLASKGITAMMMASAMVGTGTTLTSCDKADDDYTIETPKIINHDKVDTDTQNKMFDTFSAIGIYPITNSENPKMIESFSFKKVGNNSVDYVNYKYDKENSDSAKSVYIVSQAHNTDSTNMEPTKRVVMKNIDGDLHVISHSLGDTDLDSTPSGSDKIYKADGNEVSVRLAGRDEKLETYKKDDDGNIKQYRKYIDIDSNMITESYKSNATFKNIKCIAK